MTKRNYQRHTKEKLAPIVASSISYAECLRKLNLVVAGGNYRQLHKNIVKFNLDTSHMLGQAHHRDREFILFENLSRPDSIKRRLVKMRGYSCELCGISEWRGDPLVLELDHIDGNNQDHSSENVRLLCPNCHSQTPTWKNRKST